MHRLHGVRVRLTSRDRRRPAGPARGLARATGGAERRREPANTPRPRPRRRASTSRPPRESSLLQLARRRQVRRHPGDQDPGHVVGEAHLVQVRQRMVQEALVPRLRRDHALAGLEGQAVRRARRRVARRTPRASSSARARARGRGAGRERRCGRPALHSASSRVAARELQRGTARARAPRPRRGESRGGRAPRHERATSGQIQRRQEAEVPRPRAQRQRKTAMVAAYHRHQRPRPSGCARRPRAARTGAGLSHKEEPPPPPSGTGVRTMRSGASGHQRRVRAEQRRPADDGARAASAPRCSTKVGAAAGEADRDAGLRGPPCARSHQGGAGRRPAAAAAIHSAAAVPGPRGRGRRRPRRGGGRGHEVRPQGQARRRGPTLHQRDERGPAAPVAPTARVRRRSPRGQDQRRRVHRRGAAAAINRRYGDGHAASVRRGQRRPRVQRPASAHAAGIKHQAQQEIHRCAAWTAWAPKAAKNGAATQASTGEP